MKTVLTNIAPGFERIKNGYGCCYFKEGRGQSNISQHVCRYTKDTQGIKVAPDDMLDAFMGIDKEFDLIYLLGDNLELKT